MILIEAKGDDEVIAHGAKPSVGGQSQRIIFSEHPDLDCIVHAHIPLKPDAPDAIPVRSQYENEQGWHQCGMNASSGLKRFGNISAVYLQNHGPNVAFPKTTPAEEVIAFMERNFDLSGKTGDLSKEPDMTPVD